MGRATHIQTSFNAGEISPLMEGRVDLQRYAASCRTLRNFLPTVEGPAERRPGTRFVVPARFQFEKPDDDPGDEFVQSSRLIPFQFSRTQAYVIEFSASHLYDNQPRGRIRFFRNNELVLDGAQTNSAVAVGAVTTFTTSAAHHLEINDLVFIEGVGGTLGPLVNNRQFQVLGAPNAPTVDTFSISLDSTGLTASAVFGTTSMVYELFSRYGAFDEINGVDQGDAFEQPHHLEKISYAQSADVLFLAHPHHPPMKLLRFGDNDWTFTQAAGGELGAPIPISTITNAGDSTVTTTTPHGLLVGDKILFTRVQGMREINGGIYKVVATPSSTTFKFQVMTSAAATGLSTTLFHDAVNPFSAGVGSVQKFVSHSWPPFDPEPLNPDDLVVATGSLEKGGTVTLYFARDLDDMNVVEPLDDGMFVKLREVPAELYPKWAAKTDFNDTVVADTGAAFVANSYVHWEGNVYQNISSVGKTGDSPPIHEIEEEQQSDHRWVWEFAHKGDGFAEITSAPDDHSLVGVVRRRLPAGAFDANAVISLVATSTAGTPVQINVASTANLTDGDRVLLYGFAVDTGLNNRLVYVDVTGAGTFDAYLDKDLTVGLTGVGGGTGGNVINMRRATSRWAPSAWRRLISGSAPQDFDGPGGPAAVAFFENRLWWAGNFSFPQTIWGSESAHFESHDAHDQIIGAVNFTLNTQELNAIEWLHSRRALVIGTQGGEFIAAGQNPDEPVSGENTIKPLLMTSHGVRPSVQPVQHGTAVLFPQRAGRQIREFTYDEFNSDEYKAPDISLLSAHLFAAPISQLALQREPQPYLFAAMSDGSLAACCYDRTQDVVGWAALRLGGTVRFDSLGEEIDPAPAQVVSLAVIPHPDGDADQVWMIVKRTVTASGEFAALGEHNVFHVEYMELPYETGGDLATEAFYVDAGVRYSGAPASVLTGLMHLVGETVQVLGDGRYLGDFVVSATGSVTLPTEVSEATVGLGYESVLETSRLEFGGGEGTAQGKFKNLRNAVLRLHETGPGLRYGKTSGQLDVLSMRPGNDPSSVGPNQTLLNGDTRELELPGDVDDVGRVYLAHRGPTPCTIVAVIAQTDVEDD